MSAFWTTCTYADSVALPAFAHHCLCNRLVSSAHRPTAANLQHRVCYCELMLGHTDRRTWYHFVEPAPHTMRAVPKKLKISFIRPALQCWKLVLVVMSHGLSVSLCCLSDGHTGESYKNGWNDPCAILDVEFGRLKKPSIKLAWIHPQKRTLLGENILGHAQACQQSAYCTQHTQHYSQGAAAMQLWLPVL